MSVKLNSSGGGSITISESVTASDTTITLPAINGTVVTTADAGTVTPTMMSQKLTAMTAQNTTSGTSIDFTSIPSWVKKITVMFRNISTNGTSPYIIRLGTSGGFVATGYSGSGSAYSGAFGGSSITFTTGFGLGGNVGASSFYSGIMTIANISGTLWVASLSGAFLDAAYTATSGGHVDAGGVVNSIRLTTVNGTDAFDSGSVNVIYEG